MRYLLLYIGISVVFSIASTFALYWIFGEAVVPFTTILSVCFGIYAGYLALKKEMA